MARCTDDPTYSDVWPCSAWVGFNCYPGSPPVNTAERIALLVASCPQSCQDVTAPTCPAPSTPPGSGRRLDELGEEAAQHLPTAQGELTRWLRMLRDRLDTLLH